MTTREWTLLPAPSPPAAAPTGEQSALARPGAGVRIGRGGPGTGKTFVAAQAVLRRVEAGSDLSRLVVLAHSRSAAQGLRRQIARGLPRAQVNPQVTTVHGLALGLLRRHAEPGEADWRLLRAPEQELRIRELLSGVQGVWPASVREALGTRAFARQLREVLARARQLSLDPEDVIEAALRRDDELFVAVGRFFEEYLAVGDLEGTIDYAELVYRARVLLVDDAVASAVAASFDAVVADDVQEMDPAQVSLLADLALLGLPLLALGDPQQRISAFRGASPTALADLATLPGAETIDLSTGFRAAEAPERALGALRSRLDSRFAPLPPRPAAGPSAVRAFVYDDEPAELAHVAQQLRQAHADGERWHDMAVIARAGRTQLGPMARELIRLGVPVEVSGDELALAGEPAVATLLLALRVAARGATPDADEARLLLLSPLCGLDGVGLRRLGLRLRAAHEEQAGSLWWLGRCLADPGLLADDESDEGVAARRLGELLASCARQLRARDEVQEALWTLWGGTGWPARLREEALGGSRRAHHELDAVVELFELASRRAQLRGAAGALTFATEVSGEEIPADTGRELELEGLGVRLVTAHRAKGLQWRRVWVVGVQEGSWPSPAGLGLLLDPDRVDSWEPATPPVRLQQERQLFYVACARAASHLTVSGSEGTDGEGRAASRFLGELGVEVERVHGRPRRPLSATGLIGELRAALTDESSADGLRRAAALTLAKMGTGEAPRAFEPARPRSWWGLREVSSQAGELPHPIPLSGSSLEALLACPRRWFLSRRAHAERGRQSRASLGDLMHLLAQHAATDHLSADEMRAHLDEVWDGIVFEAEYLSQSERIEIDRAVERFAYWHERNPHRVLAVERPFQVRLHVEGHEVLLHGVVDRLELDTEGRLRVVDFKTGAAKPADRQLRGMIQLGVYQLAARLGAFDDLAPGVRMVAPPVLALLRHGDLEPECFQQASLDEAPAIPGEELEVGPTWVHDRIAQAVRILRAGAFDATECAACRYCAFANSCPVQLRGRPVVR